MSEAVSGAQLALAFANAQGEFPVIPKDSEVQVKSKEGKFLYAYKYADLTTIISTTRPSLAKHGLCFTQGVVTNGFATTLLHSSGESLVTGFIPFELPKNADMKTIAGLLTYIKRISLTAALGVSADEDVDAAHTEAQHGNVTTKEPPVKKTQPASAPTAKPAPKVSPNHAPANAQLIERINSLCIDRQVSETELHGLIFKGYGFELTGVPTWAAMEIAKLLDNEDTTSRTIIQETQRVASRRAAAEIKNRKAP